MSQTVSLDTATAGGETDALTGVAGRPAVTNGRLSVTPRSDLRIVNWNVRTTTNRLNLLADELLRYQIDLAVITEAKIPGEGCLTVSTTDERSVPYLCYHSGGEKRMYGVAFMVNKRHSNAIVSFEAVSDRIAVMELTGTVKLTVVGVYAPHNELSDGTKDQFYSDLQAVVSAVPSGNVLVVAGDLNAETGSEREGWDDVMGPFGRVEQRQVCSTAEPANGVPTAQSPKEAVDQ